MARRCLNCNRVLRLLVRARGSSAPRFGNPALCWHCGIWLILDDTRTGTREASLAEFYAIEANPASQQALQAWRLLRAG
jgi:hypothetical protein